MLEGHRIIFFIFRSSAGLATLLPLEPRTAAEVHYVVKPFEKAAHSKFQNVPPSSNALTEEYG